MALGSPKFVPGPWLLACEETRGSEVEARRQYILKFLLDSTPRVKEQLIEEGRHAGELATARAALRRVLARRQIASSADDEARIEACTDLATLERWHDQAVTAASVAEALA